jgi:hypothetical protein
MLGGTRSSKLADVSPNDDTLLDYICGHSPASVGRAYGEPTLRDMAAVIERFPRYDIGERL